jgi:hypothetical protein
MMVDASIKKSGGKDLAVVQGEILEIIQLTSDKKALCRNEQGKCMRIHHPLVKSFCKSPLYI